METSFRTPLLGAFALVCLGLMACQGGSDTGLHSMPSDSGNSDQFFAGYDCNFETVSNICQVNVCKLKESVEALGKLCEDDPENEECLYLDVCPQALETCIEEVRPSCDAGDELPLLECTASYKYCKHNGSNLDNSRKIFQNVKML